MSDTRTYIGETAIAISSVLRALDRAIDRIDDVATPSQLLNVFRDELAAELRKQPTAVD